MLKTKIISYLSKEGNKRTSEKSFLKILKSIQESSNKDSRSIVKFSLIKVSPFLSIKKKKRNRQMVIEIPFLLKSSSRIFFAVKEIISIVQRKKKSSFFFLFKHELLNSLIENNEILKEKKEVYQKAFIKKAFAHFRWF